MSSFFVHTMGCRCNQADSVMIQESLCRKALTASSNHKDADLVVVNTCTVTHRTDQQVRQLVRKVHRENPAARLVVTGCYAQRDPDALADIAGVSLVVGNSDKERLAEILLGEGMPKAGIIRTPLEDDRDYLLPPVTSAGGKTRPFIKIQDGCDARCSYCIVPSVRGPARSARPAEVLAQVKRLVSEGFKEVVLTGVHLGTYGKKSPSGASLVGLLRQILETPDLGRLRLSSIEPMRFSREIVRLAEKNSVFARHFHIPLQSGSDRVLRRMRRPYKAQRFVALLSYIVERLPEASIGTDVLVGFPGESETDFEATLDLVERTPLCYLHVFPYSPRAGTDATSLPEQVPTPVIAERAARARELSAQKSVAFRQSLVGHTLPALTLSKTEERHSQDSANATHSMVLTDNYIHAQIPDHPNSSTPAPKVEPNRLVQVLIEEVQPDRTVASLVHYG